MKHNHFLPFLFLTLIVLALASSCQNNYGHKRIIDLAERIVEDHPDSALLLLNTFQKENIQSPRLKARYGIVKSMAYTKTWIEPGSDSLIGPAVKYFTKRREYDYQMKAWYYLGRVHLVRKEYNAAMYANSRATEAAEKTSDDKFKGLIHMGLENVFTLTFCIEEALKEIELALPCFERINDRYNYNMALIRKAEVFLPLKKWKEAESILDSFITNEPTDTILMKRALPICAKLCMARPDIDPQKCLTLYSRAQEYRAPLNAKDWCYMAIAYSKLGQIDTAEDILAQIETAAPEYQLLKNYKAYVARDKGDFKTAFEMLDKSYEVEGDIVRQTLSQSSIAAQRDYFEAQKKEEELVARKRALVIAQISLGSLITLGILVFSFTRRRGRDERRLKAVEQEKTKWQSMSEMNSETLKVVADGRNAEQAELNRLRQEQQRAALRNLQSRFKILGPLEVVYEENRNKHEFKRENIYQAVKRLLTEYFGDEQAYRRLEKLVNTELDNFIKTLRSETKFSEKEYQIVCYDLLGLPAEQIATLTNLKKDSIYSLLTRMRANIRQSNYPHREWFLVLLDSRSVVHMN